MRPHNAVVAKGDNIRLCPGGPTLPLALAPGEAAAALGLGSVAEPICRGRRRGHVVGRRRVRPADLGVCIARRFTTRVRSDPGVAAGPGPAGRAGYAAGFKARPTDGQIRRDMDGAGGRKPLTPLVKLGGPN